MINDTSLMSKHGIKAVTDSVVCPQIGYNGVLQEQYDRIRVQEALVTDSLSKVAGELGVKLEGLEYSVKTGSSVANKLMREERKQAKIPDMVPKTQQAILSELRDVIRYTEICDHDDIIPATQKTIEAMEQQGYKLSAISNYFAYPYPNTEYMGMHLNFINPLGYEFELQIHSPESFDVKMRGHELYEKIRVLLDDKEKDALKAQIVSIHQSIPKPPGCDTIDNYLISNREKENYISECKATSSIICSASEPHPEDRSHVMAYTIKKDNRVIAEGYEVMYSDGSAETCSHLVDSGIAVTTGVYPDASVAFSREESVSENTLLIGKYITDVEFTITNIQEKVQEKEQKHEKWMELNMPERSGPDIQKAEAHIPKTDTVREDTDER